ncbi:MAG: phage major capsid protein [Planctomycetota bacterium]|nr:MAG: phage major capsid protein [Planctomycetota bacterium]
MLIKLLEIWKNGPDTHDAGKCFEIKDEQAAEKLIADGIAEKFSPEANGFVKADAVLSQQGMTEDEVKRVVNDILKTSSNFKQNQEESDTGGYDTFGQFAADVKNSTITHTKTGSMVAYLENQKASGMSEGVDSDGGYAVPTEFRNTLMKNVLEASSILGKCHKIPMATNSLEVPIIQETTHQGSVYGGVIVYRVAEAATIASSKVKLGKVRLTLSKIAALSYATNELLEDSPISMEALIGNSFTEALAFQIDEDIMNGTGVGQMLGVLNAPCLVSVAKETSQTADTIVKENIFKMWSRMLSRSHKNAYWFANQDTFPQLADMTIGSGTAVRPMMVNNTILGRPVVLTEHCQTIGDVGDIVLGDFSQYLVGQKAGGSINTATSVHLKFVEDEAAFRFTVRIDGQPWMPSALTPKNSSNTLSSFIVTAARA